MPRQSAHRLAKRDLREWVLRGGLAAVALALGSASTVRTLAFVLHKDNPERAYALAPGDGRVAGQLAEQIAASDTDAVQRARATRLAHKALVDEPLAVTALTALALNTQLTGNSSAARRLFLHSDAVSRRDLGTRLWLIEDAVAHNDVVGALHHYDIALRTAKGAPDLLFPVLSDAVVNPQIAQSLAATLAKRPAWGDAFVQYLGASKADPVVSAAFFRRLDRFRYPVSPNAQTAVVDRLFTAGLFDDAWQYYTVIRPSPSRTHSRDPDFSASLQAPSVFDWVPVMNDAGVNASIQRTGERGIFEFSAPSTVGGLVLQQLQFLPPGRYRLDGMSTGIEQSPASRPYWQLSCMDGRELGRIMLPNSSEMNGRFTGSFTVGGSNCAAQTLQLIAQASAEVGGVTGQINRVLLTPIGATDD